jgi:hypothetical protein
MTLFEDILEVWHESENRVQGPKELDTLIEAIDENIHDADDVSVVMDWETTHDIADQLDYINVEYDGIVPREHVNLSTDYIGKALGGKTIVMGGDASTTFGIVLHPCGVSYENQILSPGSVVAINFTD